MFTLSHFILKKKNLACLFFFSISSGSILKHLDLGSHFNCQMRRIVDIIKAHKLQIIFFFWSLNISSKLLACILAILPTLEAMLKEGYKLFNIR